MKKIITISREYGAGGHSIGKQVAQQLGIPFYDKDILRESVKASGFDTELVETEEEDSSRADSFFRSLCSISSAYYRDSQEAIHDVQKAVILRFAQEGPCVILGRCADEFLREAGHRQRQRVHSRRRCAPGRPGQRADRQHQRHRDPKAHGQEGRQPPYLLHPLHRQKVGRQPQL